MVKLLVKINQYHPDMLEPCNFPHLVAKGTDMDNIETLPFDPSASMMGLQGEAIVIDEDEPGSKHRYCQEESMPCCESNLPKSKWCAICLENSVDDEIPATQVDAFSEDELAKMSGTPAPTPEKKDETPLDLADAKVPLVTRRQQLQLGKTVEDDEEEDEEGEKPRPKAKAKAKARAKAKAKAKALAKAKAKAKAKSSSQPRKRKSAKEDPLEQDKKKHKNARRGRRNQGRVRRDS